MSLFAWNCRGLGSSLAVRILTYEVKAKDPTLVFLAEMKAGVSRMKGIQWKLEHMQGLSSPTMVGVGALHCYGKRAPTLDLRATRTHMLMWWFTACSPRTHGVPPDSSKRDISWKLLDALRNQCDMPWVVFGDFNKIVHPDEKLGGADRDAGQMEAFRDCLNRCGLCGLGFVGQKFTWCNGCFGAQ
ncbi:uncharacterized protein LOC142606375 [Castanea sativa]|uniref:uncharacterized protein LOC142606375 n=1 Tax=Castanea sativa TaxID=21020 RepID=UPI003F65381A